MCREKAEALMTFIESLDLAIKPRLWQSAYGFRVGLEDEHGTLVEGAKDEYALTRSCAKLFNAYSIQIRSASLIQAGAGVEELKELLSPRDRERFLAITRLRAALLERYVHGAGSSGSGQASP